MSSDQYRLNYGEGWEVIAINEERGTITLSGIEKVEKEVDNKKPPGRPKWVPEGAVRMIYYNPSASGGNPKGPEEVWIDTAVPEREMTMKTATGIHMEKHRYAINRGWLLSKFLSEEPEVNEFGPISP